jgi:hypothetical protein
LMISAEQGLFGDTKLEDETILSTKCATEMWPTQTQNQHDVLTLLTLSMSFQQKRDQLKKLALSKEPSLHYLETHPKKIMRTINLTPKTSTVVNLTPKASEYSQTQRAD